MQNLSPGRHSQLGKIALSAAAACVAQAAQAQSDDNAARVEALRQEVAAHAERLQSMRRALAEEEARLAEIQRALGLENAVRQRAEAAPPAPAAPSPRQTVAQAPTQVGQAPQEDHRSPQVAPIFEQPGVLTPHGRFVLEPSLQYSYSSTNRVALVGYTIIPAIVIGVIDVREVKRNTFTGTLTGRYGVTNRFELEARIPYVYRADSTVGREVLDGAASDTVFDASGQGIGDVELSARLQFNDGGADSPYFIGGLRVKSRTGKDPFEVQTSSTIQGIRDALQTELPTGSGFYGLQPSLTVLYPSDPAVFFGSVSYLYSFGRNNVVRNTTSGPEALGSVKPGGVFGFNFGMGLALNERSSFSIGYDHSSVGKTLQNGQPTPGAVQVQLGTLLMGYAYRLSPQRSFSLSLGAGLTRDTPDVTLTLRVPVMF